MSNCLLHISLSPPLVTVSSWGASTAKWTLLLLKSNKAGELNYETSFVPLKTSAGSLEPQVPWSQTLQIRKRTDFGGFTCRNQLQSLRMIHFRLWRVVFKIKDESILDVLMCENRCDGLKVFVWLENASFLRTSNAPKKCEFTPDEWINVTWVHNSTTRVARIVTLLQMTPHHSTWAARLPSIEISSISLFSMLNLITYFNTTKDESLFCLFVMEIGVSGVQTTVFTLLNVALDHLKFRFSVKVSTCYNQSWYSGAHCCPCSVTVDLLCSQFP